MTGRLIAFSLLAALAAGSVHAQEWQAGSDRSVVLVTPEGDVLDYVPDASDVIVKRNRRGQRVLLDHYGNIIATEMPSRRQRARSNTFDDSLPGVTASSQRNRNAEIYSNRADAYDPDYFPDPPQSDGDFGEVTGSVPDNFGSTGLDLDFENQPLPGDGIASDNGGSIEREDLASVEPTERIYEDRPANLDPVITLNGKSRFEIMALQVFLDREGASPGVIDGKMGSNVSKAIVAYEKMTGEKLDPNNSEDIMARLGINGGLPIIEYTITSADAAGPYVAAIPEDYSHKAALPAMSYTSVTEALAERFHMDEDYLKELNPGKDFTIPGTVIKVVNPGEPRKGEVARIVADKGRKQLFAYDAADRLIAAYPASIGSADTPSPSGLHAIERIAFNPNYTYNPKKNFQQGQNTKVLTIQPGPNGPVGTVWIALDKPSYGIHGTPDPSRIGKTQSHGCIRLTNWDATELAKMVKPGVMVEFID
jgi:lipoprotein-anchoring transpeptidase ErfK/SrfK